MPEDEIRQVNDKKMTRRSQSKVFLGKKGMLTEVMRGMGKLSKEERPEMGKLAMKSEVKIEGLIESVKAEKLEKEALTKKLKQEKIDVTIPGKRHALGKKHPLTQAIEEMEEIFIRPWL